MIATVEAVCGLLPEEWSEAQSAELSVRWGWGCQEEEHPAASGSAVPPP